MASKCLVFKITCAAKAKNMFFKQKYSREIETGSSINKIIIQMDKWRIQYKSFLNYIRGTTFALENQDQKLYKKNIKFQPNILSSFSTVKVGL